MKNFLSKKSNTGFTLLEVMIAISIMAVAFGAILTAQSRSIVQTIRTKELNTAGWLAHKLMVETEHAFEDKPFESLTKEEGPKAFDKPFDKYQWKKELKEIKFPELTSLFAGSDEKAAIPAQMTMLISNLTKYLSKSLRELVITVTWQRGSSTQQFVLSTYLVDLNQEFTITQ